MGSFEDRCEWIKKGEMEQHLFQGRDHDEFPAFMHFTENTTGVGACVHAQYGRRIWDSGVIIDTTGNEIPARFSAC